MPKAAKASTAAKENPTKTTKAATDAKKEKRAPTAYNTFFKTQLPIWKAQNPDKHHKEAMAEIGAIWKESDENPNKGKPVKEKKPKKAVLAATT